MCAVCPIILIRGSIEVDEIANTSMQKFMSF